jgi:hypothetical protein
MSRRTSLLLLVLLPLSACVSGGRLSPLAAGHPASPRADEAPSTVLSDTLALPDAHRSGARRAGKTRPADVEQGGGGHAHH